MFETAFLICALSTFTVQAIPPPLAFVNGVYHEQAYVALFSHLESHAWKHAEMRYGERSNGGRVILVGQNKVVEKAFLAAGWAILKPPYVRDTATMILYLPPLGGNDVGKRRIITDLTIYLKQGGLFVVQPLELPEDIVRFVMHGFEPRLGGVKVEEHYYDVFQRRNGRASA